MPRNLLAHRAVDLRASRSLCKTVYYCGNNPSIAYGTYMAAPLSATVPQSSAHAEGLRQAGRASEDALLQQALAMSMAGGDAMPAAAPAEAEEEVDDDLAKAMAMSVEGTGAAGASDAGTGGDLNDLVSGLPGVDVNDPALQAALAASLEEDMKDADAAEEKDSE